MCIGHRNAQQRTTLAAAANPAAKTIIEFQHLSALMTLNQQCH
jgi:hypothetical protein